MKRVRTLTLDAVRSASSALAEAVRAAGVQPSVVVAIHAGGTLPGLEVARHLGAEVIHVGIGRSRSWPRRAVAGLLRSLPLSLTSILRRLDRRTSGVVKGSREVRFGLPEGSLTGRKVVIVDDAADTGATLERAVEVAKQAGAAEVWTAVLTVTLNSARSMAQFRVYEDECRFPWSSDYPNRAETEAAEREIETCLNRSKSV